MWYENEKELENAISFVLEYACCFNWTVFASAKTRCYDYKAEDAGIPEGLKDAIRNYYKNLSKKERGKLNWEFALLLGERFFVREDTIIKILSRILRDGNPVKNNDMIVLSLQMQIKQRIELLEKLV